MAMRVAPPPRTPAAPPPRGTVPIAVAPQRQPAPAGRDPSCTAAWVLIAVLCAFKIVTIGLIALLAFPHPHLLPMLAAMNWPWLIVLAILLSVIPFGFWFRLVRVRARRRQLQRAEWHT